jgi:hypothetical protein
MSEPFEVQGRLKVRPPSATGPSTRPSERLASEGQPYKGEMYRAVVNQEHSQEWLCYLDQGGVTPDMRA